MTISIINTKKFAWDCILKNPTKIKKEIIYRPPVVSHFFKKYTIFIFCSALLKVNIFFISQLRGGQNTRSDPIRSEKNRVQIGSGCKKNSIGCICVNPIESWSDRIGWIMIGSDWVDKIKKNQTLNTHTNTHTHHTLEHTHWNTHPPRTGTHTLEHEVNTTHMTHPQPPADQQHNRPHPPIGHNLPLSHPTIDRNKQQLYSPL